MNEPIVITPQEIVNLILAICGAIITISGAGTIIIRAIGKMKEPNKKQDERLDKVETEIASLKERYRESNHELYLYTKQMEDKDNQQAETNRIIIEGLQALTDHALDHNNVDALKESKRQLDRYLISRVTS